MKAELPSDALSKTQDADLKGKAERQVGGLKTITVLDGHQQKFETLFGELRAAIAAQEPGCLLYSLLKSATNPRAYIVQEQYRDRASLKEHEQSEHGRHYFPKIRAILESISVEYFEVIVP
jgi:quinol monooxygenase YgiN